MFGAFISIPKLLVRGDTSEVAMRMSGSNNKQNNSDSKRSSAELTKLRNRFRVLVERPSEGLVILGHDGEILFANRSAKVSFSLTNDPSDRLPFNMKIGQVQFGHITKGKKTIAIKLVCERVVWDSEPCRLVRFRAMDAAHPPYLASHRENHSSRHTAREFVTAFADNYEESDHLEVAVVYIPTLYQWPAMIAQVEYEAMTRFVVERLNGLVSKNGAFQTLSDECWVGVCSDNHNSPGTFVRTIHEVLHEDLPEWLSARNLVAYVGGAIRAPKTKSAAALWEQAESAMILSRHQGCAEPQFYDEEMQEWLNATEKVIASLRAAITYEKLQVHYQPIIDVYSGEVVAAEALIRWPHETLGMLRAAEFLPAAAEAGFMTDIDHFVAKKSALLTASIRRDTGKQIPIMMNASAESLASCEYCDLLTSLVDQYDLRGLLGVEISEQISVSAIETTVERLEKMRSAGISFAFDDFAMKESSLVLFRLLIPEFVKADYSFVNRCTNSDLDRALVESIVALAQRLGVTVVAEGVETGEQLKLLQEIGCARAQGELIAMPFSEDHLREFIQKPFEHDYVLTESS